jgi:hypothetical protein
MTQDEIIEMARQAGMEQDGENFFSCNHDEIDVHITDLTAFAKLVAAKEREACAKLIEVSDDVADWEIICGSDGRVLLNAMAEAIRARGEA